MEERQITLNVSNENLEKIKNVKKRLETLEEFLKIAPNDINLQESAESCMIEISRILDNDLSTGRRIFSKCDVMVATPADRRGYYRHFKGKWYRVLHKAIDANTDKEIVVYQALYGDKLIYTRDFKEFMSFVDNKKHPEVREIYRFTSYEELVRIYGKSHVDNLLIEETI